MKKNILLSTFALFFGVILSSCEEPKKYSAESEIKTKVEDLSRSDEESFIYESDPSYLSSSFTLSYYSPGFGTVDLTYGKPPYNPSMRGKDIGDSILILNNVGRYIVSMESNGNINWVKKENETPQSLFIDSEGVIGYSSHKDIVKIDLSTGQELFRENVFNKSIRFIKRLDAGKYLIGFNTAKQVKNVVITDKNFKITYELPLAFSYPRGVDILGNLIVVADTFGHRVLVYDKNKEEIIKEIDEYFPNAVQFKDSENLYILGEHSNRLYTHNIATGLRTNIMTAPDFKNPYLTSSQITSLEHSGKLDGNKWESNRPISKAAIKYSEVYTLYSPNGFLKLKDGTFMVADTDNHRIVHISSDGKEIIRIISGLNNPSSVLTF